MIEYPLFPTLVTFSKYKGLTQKEIKFLIQQEERGNKGNTTSVDTNILNNKKMEKLKKFIEKSVQEYFQNIYVPKNKVEPYITQSWCNYTKEGQYHHKHEHPNSFVSGVFYVQADRTKDKIYLCLQSHTIVGQCLLLMLHG